MLFLNRRVFLTLCAVSPVVGCGFTPVYGPDGPGTAIRGRVRIAAPTTRLGFELVSRLEDRLGRAATPTHTLTHTIQTEERGLAITDADDITRINISGTVQFTVIDAQTQARVQAGAVSTFTAYATTGSPVATAAARRNAEDRLMIALADQIVTRLYAGAQDWG